MSVRSWIVAAALAAAAGALPAPYAEPLRPRFHFTPARNFMNDPNGLVFDGGEYHLFYQHNPFGPEWGHMSWGHAVSPDLVHWTHLPVALREENGVMIFSGSVVADPDDTSGLCGPPAGRASCLIAIYTGHGLGKQTQNLAFSTDRGRTWTKYAGNPVLDLGLKEFRDPKVFWHAPTRRWILLTVLADQHKLRIFGSSDLKAWEALSDFGPAGATGGAWECPDLFPLAVDGASGDTRWVLDIDINPGGQAGGSGGQYFVGTFDGRTFVNDNPPATTLWVDYGKDFYATLSFSGVPASDGRRIWMGWMSNWLYANVEPTAPWRGVQSVPRALSLTRRPEGIRLVQTPVAELRTLRTTSEPTLLTAPATLPAFGRDRAGGPAGRGRGCGAAPVQRGRGRGRHRGGRAGPRRVRRPPPLAPDRLPRGLPGAARGARALEGRPGHAPDPVRPQHPRGLRGRRRDGVSERVYPTRPLERIEVLRTGASAVGPVRLWALQSIWP